MCFELGRFYKIRPRTIFETYSIADLYLEYTYIVNTNYAKLAQDMSPHLDKKGRKMADRTLIVEVVPIKEDIELLCKVLKVEYDPTILWDSVRILNRLNIISNGN